MVIGPIQNSINAAVLGTSGGNTLNVSSTTQLVQSALQSSSPLPQLQVANAGGGSQSLESLVAANLATNTDFGLLSSLNGLGNSASTDTLLAASFGASFANTNSLLSASFGTPGTELDLLV